MNKVVTCWAAVGDTVAGLHALPNVSVTAQLKRGRQVSTTVNLCKIGEHLIPDKKPQIELCEAEKTATCLIFQFSEQMKGTDRRVCCLCSSFVS